VRRSRTRRPVAAALAAAATLGAGGCGVGAGDSADGASLLVTRDFGTATLVQRDAPEVGGSDTVMRLLQRNAKIETRFGGGFVQAIDGVAGGVRGGRSVDWFFYVNGVPAEKGAASVKVDDGDRIWWDHHDWETGEVQAVVGQFPAPFTTGIDRRLPVRVECTDQEARSCLAVRDALVKRDVAASRGGLQRSLARETLRVLVGRWETIRGDQAARTIEEGPSSSGVFARIDHEGRALELLDERGRTTRTLRTGAGLVAATAIEGAEPVWVVTGTDDAGVDAAARSFDEVALAGRFAVAVTGGRVVALPDRG